LLNETYALDAWGNLQQSGNFSFVQAFGSNNRISTGGYSYDQTGDLIGDGINSYSYDAEGKLVSSSGASYVYDASGQRVQKIAGGNTGEYIYFNGQPLALFHPSNGTYTDLIWAGGTMLAEVPGNQTASPLYRLTDHLGSLALETDGSGNVVGSNLYAPYGQLMTSSTSDPYAFTGLEHDTENGSYHAWARNYTIAQGRWLRPDPDDGSYDLMNPQSFNRYSYVNGNPLMFTDPTGLDGNPIGAGGTVGGCVSAALSEGGNVYADIGCGLSLLKDLFGLFGGGPTFHGSLQPRPRTSTGVWNDTFGIPYGGLSNGITGALGLPSGGCEFGACGGGMEFTNNGSLDPSNRFQYTVASIAELLGFGMAYANWGDPNERLFGTHWCGPGGGGREVNQLDSLCHVHDNCFASFGVDASVNMPGHHNTPLSPEQITGITGCNQVLATGAKGLIGKVPGASYIHYWLTNGYGFLYPGTNAH